MSQTSTTRSKGILLVTISALLFSTPGLFTRAVVANAWDITFWRGIFGVCLAVLFLAARGGLKTGLFNVGKPGLIAAIIWASGSIAFIQSFKLTAIANVSMIYGSAPLMTALLAWLWFREKPRNIVLIASIVGFGGVFIIGIGSAGSIHLTGDLLALWMTLTGAVGFVIFRKYPQISAAGTTVVASFLVLPVCLLFSNPLLVAPHEIAICALFGVVFAVAATLMTEGSKFIPSGEAALLSNLEVPLQPVLAWLIFSELPARATFLGGFFVLIAIGLSILPSRVKT